MDHVFSIDYVYILYFYTVCILCCKSEVTCFVHASKYGLSKYVDWHNISGIPIRSHIIHNLPMGAWNVYYNLTVANQHSLQNSAMILNVQNDTFPPQNTKSICHIIVCKSTFNYIIITDVTAQ